MWRSRCKGEELKERSSLVCLRQSRYNSAMNRICREIFKAVHEGKWLKIEYRNREEQVTKYWIGIRDLNPRSRTLKVDGLHVGKCTVGTYDKIFIDSILSSEIVEGSFCPVNKELTADIAIHPEKYEGLFSNTANLKILSYLELCSRLDTTPYLSEYELIRYIDGDSFTGEEYPLSDEQFREIVAHFQYRADKRKEGASLRMQRLALNVLSIHTQKGLYVLAYRCLNLDVKRRVLKPDEDITICTQFTVSGTQESVRRFLDAEEYELLNDFERNLERIKDMIAAHGGAGTQVDDLPYVIGLGMDVVLDLHGEYKAILDSYDSGKKPEIPIQAFFGDLLARPRRTKAYPIALVNRDINVDQLLAINNAMKYPLAYIQGPPGTGKTNTIINTIATAFFNNVTVLFTSYNNIPIDNVYDRLSSLTYHGRRIPFPVLRLGNLEKVRQAIAYIQDLRRQTAVLKVFESTLDRRRDDRADRAKQLSNRLKEYEEVLDLKERRETLVQVMEYQAGMKHASALIPFQLDLQGHQLQKLDERIRELGEISDEDALRLLDRNEEELFQYLFYTSAKHIKALEGSRFEELRKILDDGGNPDDQAKAFNKYLKKSEHVKLLQKVFPVIITTCISAHRLGEPEPLFDMTIIDEASQCNVAASLVPVLRGKSLMLVGDPQQLRPVIVLDELTNRRLRRKYHVADEYDYRENSIYKTFLACDAVSDEVLLRNHYRCNRMIIGFNNKKYYNSRLTILSKSTEEHPLIFLDVPGGEPAVKNTAPEEVEEILRYAKQNSGKSIAVITPFVNQRRLIEERMEEEKADNLVCGTVHAFQGDEKDVVLFSTALSERTTESTYHWLKNNKELINVATSRAKDKLVLLANEKELNRLHKGGDDDLYELVQYIRSNGQSQITERHISSRALGVQPFSTATESAFLDSLTHALENIWMSESRYAVKKEVPISHVFREDLTHENLFYTGRFDFVVYQKQGRAELPLLAIELDGKEHLEDEAVRERDRRKNEICAAHDMQIIRVENSYARRYNHIKGILEDYFSRMR